MKIEEIEEEVQLAQQKENANMFMGMVIDQNGIYFVDMHWPKRPFPKSITLASVSWVPTQDVHLKDFENVEKNYTSKKKWWIEASKVSRSLEHLQLLSHAARWVITLGAFTTRHSQGMFRSAKNPQHQSFSWFRMSSSWLVVSMEKSIGIKIQWESRRF